MPGNTSNPSSKRKILLTGAAGNLGRAVRQAAEGRHEIVSLDLKSGGDARVHEGDFTDAAFVRKWLPGCDAVIHTAALHGGNRQTHSPTQYTIVNVAGLATLLELCLEFKVKRFVFSSTMEVLIGWDWMASGASVLDENSPPKPDWIYPVNKYQGEILGAHYYHHHGIEFVALRYMEFGAQCVPSPYLLARQLMSSDVGVANVLAATVPHVGFEVLHIGPDSPITYSDIQLAHQDPAAVVDGHWPGASKVLKAKGVELKAEHFWPVTRIERAKRVLGWSPAVTFETYLKTLGWKGEACTPKPLE